MLLALLAVLLIGGAVAAQDAPAYTAVLGGNAELGPFLVDANGMTLYTFANDTPGVTNCYDECAANWPPLTVEEDAMPTLDPAASGMLGVIERTDGLRQVTYNGWPLYYWVNDAQAGDTTGHLVRDVWFVASTPQVGLGGNAQLGKFLVGANGMTLYTFSSDTEGVSNCADECAANWPPMTVESAEALTAQPGLAGEIGSIERADGGFQATLNGMPLYFWVADMKPGDATGQGVGGVWFVAALPTVSVSENADLGPILTGPNGMTLYTFANDTAGASTCTDGCAVAWPPLTVAAGETVMAGEGVTGELATITRADGSLQVTYNDMPLYYWINDIVPGDTTGHNFRDVWFAAQP
jgi:predicted lipoprotein with Yx(FWY)xxD motif